MKSRNAPTESSIEGRGLARRYARILGRTYKYTARISVRLMVPYAPVYGYHGQCPTRGPEDTARTVIGMRPVGLAVAVN
jgi:hypothetical protein